MGSISRRSQQRASGLQARRAPVGEEERKTRSVEAESEELRARIDAMGKNEGVQNEARHLFVQEEGDLEEVWGYFMEVEDEDDYRRIG